MNLQSVISDIRPADTAYAKAAKQKWDAIAKPLGSLGLLEEFVSRICAMTGSLTPQIKKRCVAVFCADNGVVCEGVTQTGSEVTAIVAKNLCTKKTSVCKMAKIALADVIPVDIGMFHPIEDSRIKNLRVAPGTQNIRSKRAMTREQAVLGIEKGIALAVELSQQGYELFATGEMGIGNTTTSSAVASVLLNRPVERMTGPGAGLSQEGVAHKIAVIVDAIRINDPNHQDPIDVLSALGGFDIAGMAGFCLGAALERKPCLIDGFISGVSALIAVRLCPSCVDYMLASHVSAEPAGALVLEALGLRPLISAGMRLGEGTGAVAAMPLLDMAFSVFDTMSTFEEVSIEAYRPL
jgi:nicotinate-nucleotide--dimethylbenzimidazole phosphoribosyltransferase